MIDELQKRHPEIHVNKLDLYEPNDNFCQLLESADWGNVERVNVVRETVSENTQYSGKYDLIIANHVFYFFLTEERCKKVFESLVEHYLSPGGSFVITHCALNNGSIMSDKLRILMSFPHLSHKIANEDDLNCAFANQWLTGESLHWRFSEFLNEKDIHMRSKLYKTTIYNPLGQLQSDGGVAALTFLRYYLL